MQGQKDLVSAFFDSQNLVWLINCITPGFFAENAYDRIMI
jgi:hypothetical protein